MSEKRARWLADRIDFETDGKVRVVLERWHEYYHLRLFHPGLNRTITVRNEKDWNSVKEAWENVA